MKDTEYAYAVAYIKTMENRMLTKNDFDALIAAPDFSSALKLLAEKGYGGKNTKDPQKLTEEEIKKAWRETENCLPKSDLTDVLKYKNDFHNLKTVLKGFMTNYDYRRLLLFPAICNPDEILKAVRCADFSGLPEFLRSSAEGAYKIITEEHDGQAMEIYVDRQCCTKIAERAKGNAFLSEWVRLNIIFTNILTAIRAEGKSRAFLKNAFIPCRGMNLEGLAEAAEQGGGALSNFISVIGFSEGARAMEESAGDFEKWCEEQKTKLLDKAKNNFFGFEPIAAFLIGKEREAQTVRIILTSKKNGVLADSIRERLE